MLFCLVYVIYVCLTIVVSNTYCVVFVGFFLRLVCLICQFLWIVFSWLPHRFFSNVYLLCFWFCFDNLDWFCFDNLDWFVLDLSGAVFSTRTVVVAAPILLVETRWVIMQCILVSMCPTVERSMLSRTFFILQRLLFKLVSMNLLHYCYFISFLIMM
jgi:hypothetical protein